MPRAHVIVVATISIMPLFGYAADTVKPTDVGQALYKSVCIACHAPENVMVSAPKAGDVSEWGKRLSRGRNGLETLTDNAVNGFGAMPPKGGNSQLTRDQIRQAIEFMLMSNKPAEPTGSR